MGHVEAGLISGGIGAAVPFLGGALFGGGVDQPVARPVSLRGRGSLEQSLISSAFDPTERNRLFQLSAANLNEQVGRNLFRRGIGGSAIGSQIQSSALGGLQNRFIEGEIQRRAQTLGLLNQRDVAEANVALQNEANRLGIERTNVAQQLSARSGLFGGLGQLAGSFGALASQGAFSGLGGGTPVASSAFANIPAQPLPAALTTGQFTGLRA